MPDNAPAPLPEDIRSLLLGLRKRAFGKLNQKRMLDLIPFLEGWKAEKNETFLQSSDGDAVRNAIGEQRALIASSYAPQGEERSCTLWALVYGTKEEAEALRER